MDAMSRNVSDFVEFFKLSGRSSEGRLERVKGIEPSYSAWEAAALPLSYTRIGSCLFHSGIYRAIKPFSRA